MQLRASLLRVQHAQIIQGALTKMLAVLPMANRIINGSYQVTSRHNHE